MCNTLRVNTLLLTKFSFIMRRFFCKFGKENQILDQSGVQTLFKVALLKNKDIKSLFILEIDERLNESDGRLIAMGFNLYEEYNRSLQSGCTPIEALREWDII